LFDPRVHAADHEKVIVRLCYVIPPHAVRVHFDCCC